MPEAPVIPDNQSLAVVFPGSFNPRIFHPLWFEREGLTRPGELAESLSEKQEGPLVTAQVSRCDIGPEISIECLTNRLTLNSATTLSEERLRSLSSDIIAKLPHIPITAVGINHTLVDWRCFGSQEGDLGTRHERTPRNGPRPGRGIQIGTASS